jgi:hypothetical protein
MKAIGPNLNCRIDRLGEQNEEFVIYDFDVLEVQGTEQLTTYKSGTLTLVGYDMDRF